MLAASARRRRAKAGRIGTIDSVDDCSASVFRVLHD